MLKGEIRLLERSFPRSHPRLQVVSASVDELTCRFVDGQGRKHTVHANITVSRSGSECFESAMNGLGVEIGQLGHGVLRDCRIRVEMEKKIPFSATFDATEMKGIRERATMLFKFLFAMSHW